MTSGELKEKRTRLGYSQTALAKVLGIHVMSLSKWERGLHRIPVAVSLALAQLRPKKKQKTRAARSAAARPAQRS